MVDGLWLTDSTFTHEGLVAAGMGKHPEFPGPSLGISGRIVKHTGALR